MDIDFASNSDRTILAFVLAVLVVGLAYRVRALNLSGAIAALILGTALVSCGGWRPGALLVAFFITSSLVTRVLEPRSAENARGSRRDAWQVVANGGVSLLFAILGARFGGSAAWHVATLASITAAAADTWATGFGRLNRRPPRSIVTWKPVPTGTSGAISGVGTAGALLAAVLLGVPAGTGLDVPGGMAILVAAGLLGSMIDSLLGASLQARIWCETCEVITEKTTHSCGTQTRLDGGVRWITNDVVNAGSIAFAGIVAAVATRTLGG